MATELSAFLSGLNIFTDNEIEELESLMTVKMVKKNTVIVRQGSICNLCYFVLKGCLRQYVLAADVEKTIAFYTEEQAVNFFTSTTQKKPAESYLVSLEDSVLLIGDPEMEAALFVKFPKLQPLVQQMVEADFGQTQDAFAEFMTSSPEERYLGLMQKRPDLIQRVSLQQLASYLGITPESLSRIRRRVATK